MMHVQLPTCSRITLWDAITAFVYGAPRDPSTGPFYPSNASIALLERLHQAARAGQVRFHALSVVGNNTYQEIDPLYFGARCTFDWNKNQILSWGLVDERECKPISMYDGQECDEVLGVDWFDVHLDQEQFASLLREMGVLVHQKLDTDIHQNVDADRPTDLSTLETSGTGLAGRPTSMPHILLLAKERLDAGDYPGTITEFAKQLARDFAKKAPKAHHPKPKTLKQNPTLREMWRLKPRKDPS
jgi:hypothetical protein